MADAAGAASATVPGFFRGRARAKPIYSTTTIDLVNKKAKPLSFLRTATSGHLAATELTAIVSPFNTPVTVAFFPACLSSVAKAALSVVSNI